MNRNLSIFGQDFTSATGIKAEDTGGVTRLFVDTSDATATASDILSGKSAYIDGVLVNGTGSIPQPVDYLDQTWPSGVYQSNRTSFDYNDGMDVFFGRSGITEINMPELLVFGSSTFSNLPNVEKIYIPKANSAANISYAFSTCPKLKAIALPGLINSLPMRAFNECTALEAVDIAVNISGSNGYQFYHCSSLTALIIRKTDSVATLGSTNAFSGTPFASGSSTPCTIYVPSDLISTYTSATNWSTVISRSQVTITAIEGSIYEAQYADGTPISS